MTSLCPTFRRLLCIDANLLTRTPSSTSLASVADSLDEDIEKGLVPEVPTADDDAPITMAPMASGPDDDDRKNEKDDAFTSDEE